LEFLHWKIVKENIWVFAFFHFAKSWTVVLYYKNYFLMLVFQVKEFPYLNRIWTE
jgi:hypothetical protein